MIEPEWLAWASQHRSTSAIARYLGLSWDTVHRALQENGLTDHHQYPFTLNTSRHSLAADSLPPGDACAPFALPTAEEGLSLEVERAKAMDSSALLDPEPEDIPELEAIGSSSGIYHQADSYTAPASQWTDDELDVTITQLRVHYPNAGLSLLHGALRALGHRVPHERIRQSLLRLDPVQRIFERRTIQCRTYSVPGPNALWHHDGQHGKSCCYLLVVANYNSDPARLIRWRIVFHGFIDRYSRLITGLRASNNNRASTVLDVFLDAVSRYRVPSRVRGDHGTENLEVAAFMEQFRGVRRGSYIWGR